MRSNRAWSGGGIAGLYAGITLIGAELRDCWAMNGGGVQGKNGILIARRTKFVANSAGNNRGAIYHYRSELSASSLSVKNTILAHGRTGGNCSLGSGSVTKVISEGHNLSSDATCRPYLTRASDRNDRNPRLPPLADNGGFTLTHLPKDGSLAIDRGHCLAGVGIDQRGVSRPQHGLCDTGSVEVLSDQLLQSYLLLVGDHFR